MLINHARALSRLIHTLRDLKYYGLEDDFLCGIYQDILDTILDLLEVPRKSEATPDIRDHYYPLFDVGYSDMDLIACIDDLKPESKG